MLWTLRDERKIVSYVFCCSPKDFPNTRSLFRGQPKFWTEKTMKTLCFSLVWHEKIMFWGGLSSLGGCVFTPTRFPGPGTSFPMFFKSLKILFFLNRKFRPRFFQNMTKLLVRTKICGYLKRIKRDTAHVTDTHLDPFWDHFDAATSRISENFGFRSQMTAVSAPCRFRKLKNRRGAIIITSLTHYQAGTLQRWSQRLHPSFAAPANLSHQTRLS